jgi:intein-encoded DNA endonuclease-like protein
MSTSQDRLDEVYLAYSNAYKRRFADLKEAVSKQQVRDVLANVRNLEATYLKAATEALDATANEVEEAYLDARQARAAIDHAYDAAVSLAEKIRLVGAGAKAVGDLVKRAQS